MKELSIVGNLAFKASQVQANIAAMIQRIRVAPAVKTFWLPISYVMAHVEIESGFDATIKASDFDTTGSMGLMQPTAATWSAITMKYSNAIAASKLPFTSSMVDPLSNLLVGMLDLWDCHVVLAPRFGFPLAYQHICDAYNEGPGREERTPLGDLPYYMKWCSAQWGWEMLDGKFTYGG